MERGTRLGPYEILEPLGAGGMGEVWLAQDIRLGRKVAIKVLPEEYAGDPERLARFEQEARAAAALNHPHIAVVHDVGSETGEDGATTHFIVQEYLQGHSLGERLEQRALPLDEALDLAIEMTEALAAAHKAGIVHRDLKPDNIFVTQQGHAKVLDFGLAKLTEMAVPTGSASISPTVVGTVAGQILGTAGYMAPEQVRGEEVDQRADLFAFGCVLYGMVTGRQAFEGRNVHDTLSRILADEPASIAETDESLPTELQRIVRKLLAKKAARRYQTANDLNIDLRQLQHDLAAGVAPGLTARTSETIVAVAPGLSTGTFVAALVLVGGLVGVATWLATRSRVAAVPPAAVFDVPLPEGVAFSGGALRMVAFSPDGTQIVVVANRQLWSRSIGTTGMVPVRGTEAETFIGSPFFSPDARNIGFYADSELKRVTATGGPAQILVDVGRDLLYGASWSNDGRIYFGLGPGGVWRVSENGGEPENVVELETGDARAPQLLPGGEWVLFTLRENPEDAWTDASVVVQSLATGERHELFRGGTDARYLPSGHIVYAHDSTLLARAFDVDRLEVAGEPVPVREGVRQGLGVGGGYFGTAHWAVSESGALVYIPNTSDGEPTGLTWYSRDGQFEVLRMPPTNATVAAARLSPTDDRIVLQLIDADGSRLVTYPIEQAAFQPFAAQAHSPAWSPDGAWLYFSSDSGGDFDIYRGQVASTVAPVPVLDRDGDQLVTDVAEDRLLFDERNATGERDIWTLALTEGAEPELVVGGHEDSNGAVFSPDGKWIAYAASDTGSLLGSAIWIQEFPGPGARYKVSTGPAAATPVWIGAGVFYDSGGRWTLVEDLDPGPGVDPAPARILLSNVLFPFRGGRNFDVSADGERLLAPRVGKLDDRAIGSSLRVVLNWVQELKQRVPTGR